MWSLFSRDPTTSFPYEIGDPVKLQDERSIFILHHAKKKSCGTPVSAFVCQGAVHNNKELALARAAVRRYKSMKHPCVLNYVDSLESEKAVYLITDPVSPLQSWFFSTKISAKDKTNISAWGINTVLRALSFFINECGLQHLNICSSSIFVTPGGEFKIGGMEYSRNCPTDLTNTDPTPTKLPPSLNVYDAPEKTDAALRRNMTKWSTDMWGFGCLIWELFTAAPLMQSGALRNTSKIPKPLIATYMQLMDDDPGKRPNPQEVLERLSKPGMFLRNDLIQTIGFLDNIHIKQDRDKKLFFMDLPRRLDNIPEFVVKNKILPATLAAQQFSDVGSVAITPLFKMGKLLSTAEYQEQVLPSVVKLFSSTDRSTRLQLLQQMEQFVEHMDSTTVNDKVFCHLITGFLDTNPTIREHTVKSIMFLAPKLNRQNLNVEVLKHFARLQAKDEQGGIRTNCTVCLSKIASNLAPATRQKCLISAFTRALRDPFPPARIAGSMALAATQQYYPVDQVAQRILPALVHLTLDPEKNVRDAVFRVIKGFMGKLEKLSENPSLKEEMEKEVNAGASVGEAAAGWAGWAMGTLTSKFYKSTISSAPEGTKMTASSSPQHKEQKSEKTDTSRIKDEQQKPMQQQNKNPSSVPIQKWNEPTVKKSEHILDQSWGDDDDNWQALEDLDDDDSFKEKKDMTVKKDLLGSNDPADVGDGWLDDDDEFIDSDTKLDSFERRNEALGSATTKLSSVSVEEKTEKVNWSSNASLKSSSSYNWSTGGGSLMADPDSDDFFTSLKTEELTAKQNVVARSNEDWGTSWDDPSPSGGDPSSADTRASSSSKAAEREAKKLERQRQIEAKRAAKGPMKLGMKKT